MDQGTAAVEPGFFFYESAHFRSAFAYGLRKRAVPESLGMLEPGHGHVHDCGRPLHAGLRLLRGDNGETVCARRRRTAARRRSRAPDEIKTRRYYGGCA